MPTAHGRFEVSAWRAALGRLSMVVALAALLALPAAGQFTLFPWVVQDDAGDGIVALSSSTMAVVADWPTEGGGAILAFKSVAPVTGRITLDMWYMAFDGACGQSVPVFLLGGSPTTLSSCTTSKSLEFIVPAGVEFGLGLITFDGTWPGWVQFSNFAFEPIPSQPTWTNLSAGLAGVGGVPRLNGVSLLYPHFPFGLVLTQAAPTAPVTLVVGLSVLQAPFKGGVLAPSPDLLLSGLSTNAQGEMELNAHWPGGVPSGFQFHMQAWILDASAPAGFSASNGLTAQTP